MRLLSVAECIILALHSGTGQITTDNVHGSGGGILSWTQPKLKCLDNFYADWLDSGMLWSPYTGVN